ncbi:acyl carrier protein [Streptodolium elevatio]|uniref:Acyl carrier protein n=1 Tax=Streptodolium elevatio TaxID=3157996 RepID=A0ABV3D8U4_9ACTN
MICTLSDLQILLETSNIPLEVELSEEHLDTPLAELGVDSPSLLELADCIHDCYLVRIPGDSVHTLRTARLILAYVNERAGVAGGAM